MMEQSNIVILNPDYSLRNDLDRVLLYSKKNVSDYSSPDWISYIHPIQAEILSLFTIVRPIQETIDIICSRYKITPEKVIRIITPYVNNNQPVYTMFGNNKLLFPKNVLMNTNSISKEKISYTFCNKDFICATVNLTPDRTHKSPQSMIFMLTNRCITNCKYCYADTKTKCKELSTDQILKIINEAASLKMSYIDIIGGEVFVKKDWNIILSELVKNDLTPNYISTKVPITESITEQLFKTGYNNVIQLSIDSLNPNILTKIIGSNKNYIKKMRAGIEILQRYGFKIQIDTILTKYNLKVEDILEMFEYIKSIKNLVYWEIRTPEKSIYNIKSFAEIKAKKGELLNIYHYIETNLIPNAPIRILTSKEPLNAEFYYGNNEIECFKEGACGALNNNCFVLPDGKVTLCEQLYWHPKFVIGDLKEQTIQQMWTSDKAKALLNVQSESNRKESACKTCNSFDFCSAKRRKCWAKIINAYGEKNWDFPDPRCEYAPVVHPDLIYN